MGVAPATDWKDYGKKEEEKPAEETPAEVTPEVKEENPVKEEN